MTCCMIDITDVNVVNIGDIVTLYGNENNKIKLEYIGKQIDKHIPEILCNINHSIPRLCV